MDRKSNKTMQRITFKNSILTYSNKRRFLREFLHMLLNLHWSLHTSALLIKHLWEIWLDKSVPCNVCSSHTHRSINNIACRQFFSFPNSHAMTSQGLTYSQCYRAARVKSDWQPVTLSSIPYMLPCWGKQLEDHNIFVWSLMSVQSWGGRGLKRISPITLEPINGVAQFISEWST